ncbi:hypothetical protein [Flammeovirga agarivorans]|uniref:Uncharacterized protein n=2 Tax=Flammeovirga TaxID=59739 RepID=A0A7X8SGE5_9BACT|nr:hypothetical protein [Flammeovirga agarivorans]NLR89607.1 hypothetical protein [Flammeovirga agarivorans]
MKQFVEYYVLPFVKSSSDQVCITGSIAYYFKEILQESFDFFQLPTPTIIASPTDGLIEYHQQ